MPLPKQHISDLAEICHSKGIRRVVISPGSRSAPLIKAFYNVFGESCISIVDERSAAYFALGLALYTQNPVVLICTSGTAVLNYAPAMAEAYYLQVPVVAVTADRPREWIDQQDNQTLRQSNIFNNFIKGSFELPQVIASEDDIWYAQRIINEAIDLSASPCPGPVHINVPLSEPLYGELPPPSEKIRIMQQVHPEISVNLPDDMVKEWKQAQRIMIVHGQDIPDSEVSRVLASFHNDGRIMVVAENIANVAGSTVISNSNLVLVNNRNSNPVFPDLILHSGGQVVSKALTGYLRRAGNAPCWRIGTDRTLIDTFRLVSRYVNLPAGSVYKSLLNQSRTPIDSGYRDIWLKAEGNANRRAAQIIGEAPFSDLRIFNNVLPRINPGTILVLGNSSIIRYSQLFTACANVKYYANRGVSGIDGSVSSAAGIAFASNKPTLAITGDLGFLYDSNALWNRELPANLRILVINNGGGGIFHILKGPSDHPGFKKYIEANHPVNIEKLAGAYGLNYYFAEEEAALDQWDRFIQDQGRAAVFEVRTDAAISASTFRQLMGTS
jgi:2-succinyl-5-enolpyruvyl-6-hydroxy-3-cyclohexene-1-carboxylate synthase